MDSVERLLRQNPWWESHKVEAVAGLRSRYLYNEIAKYLDEKQIVSIVGLRRVGKTTLLLQLAARLLEACKDPKRILYFSFDEILARNPEIIEQIIVEYENSILKSRLENVWIFFDEINHVPDWQVMLKRFYDATKRVKFFVSGSSSVMLRKAKESLAGRLYEFQLRPLDFREYLYLKEVEVKDPIIQSLELRRQLNSYMLNGAFPETVHEEDFEKIKKYVQSVAEKIVFNDIPKVYDVGQPEILKEMLSIISLNPGMELRYDSLASALGVTYQTISKYANYLEKAFLTRQLYNYSGSRMASARKLKKAYPSCTTIAAAFCENERAFYGLMPRLAELLVANHLGADNFWKKRYEVDVVHERQPFEVKYGASSIKKEDLKGTLDFMRRFKARSGTLVTGDISGRLREAEGVEMIPLWRFLLGPERKGRLGNES